VAGLDKDLCNRFRAAEALNGSLYVGATLVEQKIKQIMADVLNLDAQSIDEATVKDHTESWDSLNHINLVMAFEQEFQVSFDVTEIESMLSYSDILEVLDRKVQN